MAMPAAGGEPPRAQKLRIMFKGAKLVEVTAPLRDPYGATETARAPSGLKQLRQSGGDGGNAREASQLPSDLIDFLSREMEECLSPLGSWVDETFANGHQAARNQVAADATQAGPATWQPSSSSSFPAKGKEADATQWWEQAAAAGARSSEASSTREGAFMDAPSPGSVSNGFAPLTGQYDGTTQPGMPAWPSSQAPAASAAGRPAPQETPSPRTAPAQPQHRHQAVPEPRHATTPQHQPRHQPQRQDAACKPQQHEKPQQRVQPKPRPKPVDWLAAEATPITASPRRDASPAAASQQHAAGTAAVASQRQKGAGAASISSAAGSRGGSLPRSATSSPQPEPATARQQSPTAARAQGLHRQKGGGGGSKRKGSPEAAHASAAKRSSPAASPAMRPAPQVLQRGTSPLAAGSQAAAAPARQQSQKLGSAAAARPSGAPPARAGSAGRAGSLAASRPAAAAAGAPVLSRGAAAGEPLGGFGAGQWHGFREGQVVWAKMAGFPHWPAQVQAPTPAAQRVREPSMQRPVFVVFFGTADFQWLPSSKLTRFGDNYRARAATRDAQLQQSLDNAWWHLGEPTP